jgi:hypothetical protein
MEGESLYSKNKSKGYRIIEAYPASKAVNTDYESSSVGKISSEAIIETLDYENYDSTDNVLAEHVKRKHFTEKSDSGSIDEKEEEIKENLRQLGYGE